MKVVCIGECMVELSEAGEGLLNRRFAGDAYNTAVYLKRARPGIEVELLTCTGTDPLSGAMRAAWAANGVGDALAFADPARRPAIYLIETDAAGDRRFHYWRGESAARGWLKALVEAGGAQVLADADLVYISGISLAILTPEDRAAAIALLSELMGKVRIAYDPNLRPILWPTPDAPRRTLAAMAPIADVLLPSRQDLEALLGVADSFAQLDALRALGAGEIALTAEADDCLVFDGQAVHALKPPPARVLDTSGGGDSFNGAYLAARLTGSDPVEAARQGLALAAKVVEKRGALVDL